VFLVLRYGIDRLFVAAFGLRDDVAIGELLAAYVAALVVALVPWSVALAGEAIARRRARAAQRRSSESAAESMQ
jgi:hypothetical protein